MSYIYVMACDDGTVKVGRSHDPGRRLSAIQTARSGAVTLAHAAPVHPRLAAAVEASAHAALAPYRLRGEWFRIDAATAVAAVDRAAIRHDAALSPLVAEAISAFEARLRDRMERAIADTVVELVDALQDLTPTVDPAVWVIRRLGTRTVETAFLDDVVVASPGARVQARHMYAAYAAFAEAAGQPAWTETRFGRWLSRALKTDRSASRRYYLDVRLANRAADPVDPQPD